MTVTLIPATIALLDLEEQGIEALASALGARCPPVWPPDPNDEPHNDWLRQVLAAQPDEPQFTSNYLLGDGELLGTAGFKGPPENTGVVEIGYSVILPRRRRGYATEAVRQLVERAFADLRVGSVVAETLPDNVASQRVLARNGFVRAGMRVDPADGELSCFERRRPA